MKHMPKCIECKFASLELSNGSPHRYHCIHPVATKGVGYRKIANCPRGTTTLTVKTSPQWCPKRSLNEDLANTFTVTCNVCGNSTVIRQNKDKRCRATIVADSDELSPGNRIVIKAYYPVALSFKCEKCECYLEEDL